MALIDARNDLRYRIERGFGTIREKLPVPHELVFQTQGSFIMDTIINPISEDYDLDYGVYVIGPLEILKRPSVQVFHNFIFESVTINNHQIVGATDKDTCVRVYYKEGFRFLFEAKQEALEKGFHVDLPIYYSNTKRCPDLAHLEKNWILSDPIEFIEWFEKKVQSDFKVEYLYEKTRFVNQYNSWKENVRKKDAQLRRIVRYLKAWCDFQGSKMPCGIILTILAADNFVGDEGRDDYSLKETLVKIKAAIDLAYVCKRPTTPRDEDLFEGYEHKDFFKQKLYEFVTAATQAINEPNQKRACAKWQSQFGNRFSCLHAMDIDENAATFQRPAIINENAKSA